ncbi:hypothetical protein Plhal703r1_c02g0008781 [Plasmopara halstedii]
MNFTVTLPVDGKSAEFKNHAAVRVSAVSSFSMRRLGQVSPNVDGGFLSGLIESLVLLSSEKTPRLLNAKNFKRVDRDTAY